ncbi:hypothetical protein C8J56DRAFT_867568 [Mycena floridula]|nr:hypothetical protein C8J56DRAFT_867568 [Mycena floridula]
MSTKIRLYDIPAAIAVGTWSPNVWKIRYALNIKGLPYERISLEYPDIEKVSKEMGAKPTTVRRGAPLYTLPMIFDPSTNTVISDSIAIVQYLDETYPDTPRLMPPGTRVLHLAFADVAFDILPRDMWHHLGALVASKLTPISREFFLKETRGPAFFKFIEDPETVYKERVNEAMQSLEQELNGMDKWYRDERLFFEDQLGFVDLVLAGVLRWCKAVWGEDSEEWKKFSLWNNGRWANLLHELEKYE